MVARTSRVQFSSPRPPIYGDGCGCDARHCTFLVIVLMKAPHRFWPGFATEGGAPTRHGSVAVPVVISTHERRRSMWMTIGLCGLGGVGSRCTSICWVSPGYEVQPGREWGLCRDLGKVALPC